MKKILSLVIASVMIFALLPLSSMAAPAVWNGSIASGFASGSGTISDPYIIKTPAQLAFFAKQVNDGLASYENQYVALGADIVLNDTSKENWDSAYFPWDPIGYPIEEFGITKMYCFMGTFDGNNKKITGVVINDKTRSDAGLFGDLANATIKNLTVQGAYIISSKNAGAIAGYAQYATITNCKVVDSNIYGEKTVGGIIGASFRTKVNGCSFGGLVAGDSQVGGIAGYSGGQMGTDGYALYSFIENCSAEAQVYSATPNDNISDDYFGGISGRTVYTFIENCSAKCDIIAGNCCGGITGTAEYSFVENCKSECSVSGTDQIGGIAGSSYDGYFDNCKSASTTLGKKYVGGIVGSTVFEDRITQSSNSGIVQGESFVGGIVGTDTGCVNIAECYNTGEIGVHSDEKNVYTIRSGGIIGSMELGGYITECYNAGNIYGGDYVGGIAGVINGNTTQTTSSVYGSYSAGDIFGRNSEGGIVGAASEYATFFDCYYLDTSALLGVCMIIKSNVTYEQSENLSSMTPLDTNAMKQQSSFTYFDFENQWFIDANAEYPYPVFLKDTFIRGDVDNDGDVDADDYITLKRIYFGTSKLTALPNQATVNMRCDIDNDDDVDADDYILLKRAYFGSYTIG